jgi:hypothetical protein
MKCFPIVERKKGYPGFQLSKERMHSSNLQKRISAIIFRGYVEFQLAVELLAQFWLPEEGMQGFHLVDRKLGHAGFQPLGKVMLNFYGGNQFQLSSGCMLSSSDQ